MSFLLYILPIRKLEEETGEIKLSLETLILSLMLILYISSGPLLKRKGIKILHASGFTMIIGILFTLLVKFLYPKSNFFKGFQFSDTIFFTFILPWIVFNAGYNSRIETFFKYFKYICLFSLSGTLISFIIILVVTYLLNSGGAFTIFESDLNLYKSNISNYVIDFSVKEILQFSAAVSATDSISSVSLLMEDNERKLNAISFGDSIINNAISISLYKIVSAVSAKEEELSFTISIEIIIKCAILFIFSFIIGGLVGMFCAYFIKYLKDFHLNRVQEISLLLLFAFISYSLCDWLNLSPMISVLSCGLFMSHYAFYNLQFQTREESALISYSLNTLAEALVFSSLGMTIVYFTTHAFSVNFIIYELITIVICRLITIFGQIYILEYCGIKSFNLKLSHKGILTVVGSIRGAISFGLAISIVSPNKMNRDILVASLIYIVFITNVLFIAILPAFKRKMRQIDNQSIVAEIDTADDKVKKADIFTFIHPNTVIEEKKKIKKAKSDIEIKQYEESFIKKIEDYDKKNILPKIVNNWPDVVENNNTVSKLIKIALGEWAENKEKNNVYKNSDTIGFEMPGVYNQNIRREKNDKKQKMEMKEFHSNSPNE